MLATSAKRKRFAGLALIAGAALTLAACAGGGGGGGQKTSAASFADCGKNPNTCNSGPVKKGGTFSVAIEKDINAWNINTANGNTFEHALAVLPILAGQAFIPYPDLTLHPNPDFVTSASITSQNPFTVTYKINPKAVWDDGTPMTADDFVYFWRAQNGKDCVVQEKGKPNDLCQPASTGGYDQITSVEGSDGGRTVTVKFAQPFTDWKALFGGGYPVLPAHIARQHGYDPQATGEKLARGLGESFIWFEKNVPTYSSGPYKIQSFQKGVAVTYAPNPKWWGKPANFDRMTFRIITDAAQEPPALQNNEVQMIYPQPQVDLVNQVSQIPGVIHYTGNGLTWEHIDLQLKNKFLADPTLRKAIFTAVDRKAIIAKTIGQFAKDVQPLNSHNFVPGQPGYKDVITPTGQGQGNVQAAQKLLTDAGYKIQGGKLVTPSGETVPSLRMRYTTGNEIRKNECELFAQQVKPLGIDVKISTTDDLGGTLSQGDYDVIVFAWVAPPAPFVGAQQTWLSTSGSNFGHWVNKQSDDLINRAARLGTANQEAYDLLNQADDIMSKDAYVLPLYQKPTFIAVYKQYANVRNNSTNVGPMYNVPDWGLRAS